MERIEAFYLKHLYELRAEFENIEKQVKAKTKNVIQELEKESIKAESILLSKKGLGLSFGYNEKNRPRNNVNQTEESVLLEEDQSMRSSGTYNRESMKRSFMSRRGSETGTKDSMISMRDV